MHCTGCNMKTRASHKRLLALSCGFQNACIVSCPVTSAMSLYGAQQPIDSKPLGKQVYTLPDPLNRARMHHNHYLCQHFFFVNLGHFSQTLNFNMVYHKHRVEGQKERSDIAIAPEAEWSQRVEGDENKHFILYNYIHMFFSRISSGTYTLKCTSQVSIIPACCSRFMKVLLFFYLKEWDMNKRLGFLIKEALHLQHSTIHILKEKFWNKRSTTSTCE